MSELMPYLRGERSGRVVGLTFDDGYRNTLTDALPALVRHGFSATCYVVSGALGQSNDWDAALGAPRQALMDLSELRQWLAAGMEVGSHTTRHVKLTELDLVAARKEITDSKSDLENALGLPIRHFCYPYGAFDSSHAILVRQAGYESATTTVRGLAYPGGDSMQMPRVLVAKATALPVFVAKVLTKYEEAHAA